MRALISVDGEWFELHARVGRVKDNEVAINIGQDPAIKDKVRILKALLDYKAATPALIQKYKKNNPIPQGGRSATRRPGE